MKTTTIQIYENDLQTLKRWKKKLRLKNFKDLINLWTLNVEQRVQNKFYEQLTTRDNYKRKLIKCIYKLCFLLICLKVQK